MFREGSVAKWLEHEYRGLNAGYVVRTRTLRALLAEADPSCVSMERTRVPIDRKALAVLAAACRPGDDEALQISITVRFSTDLADACVVMDALAAEVLRRAENFGSAYPFRDGRLVLPLSLGVDLVSRYGGTLQALFL